MKAAGFPLWAYLRFLLRSTNEHGVHSPFVFSYLTGCLYAGPRLHPHRAIDVLLKSIPYFQAGRCWFSPGSETARDIVQENYRDLQEVAPYDILFLSGPDPGILLGENLYHNQSLCIVDQIHRSPDARRRWETIKGLENVRVTIDGFFCGLVFFRKEQARQHFRIRI